MEINIKQAVKYFFSNPSLEMVYFEAVANAIDAKANDIRIEISIEDFNAPKTLSIKITDNGVGFTDERFAKFCKLLDVDEKSHKGVGRLVYLHYFNKIEVTSFYKEKKREFVFSKNFGEKSNEQNSKVSEVGNKNSGSTLIFKGYDLAKIKSYDYLKPLSLKFRILEEFYPQLYTLKQKGEDVKISITLKVDSPNSKHNFTKDSALIDTREIKELSVHKIDNNFMSLFDALELHYSISENKTKENQLITALCIDGRTYKVDLIAKENVPIGYDIIFLLYSDSFNGKVNASRQELTLTDNELKTVKSVFREGFAELLAEKIPSINIKNKKIRKSFSERYPHLSGYLDDDSIGFSSKDEILNKAQAKFFKAQKEVLDASKCSDDLYQKTLNIASRTLTEYILYRQIIIEKVKEIDEKDSEKNIHKLILPMQEKLKKSDFESDLYRNNVWLLDDKYMSYSTILSDKEMTSLVDIITEGEVVKKDESRPDIAIVFSDDPQSDRKVDVVIVELKKKEIPLAKSEEVVSQLKQRARRLMNYYGDRIQRIWFYGVVDFSEEFTISLVESDYIPLYSKGKVYYGETKVIPNPKTMERVPIGIYLMDIDAFILDAETRNSTFLNILKSKFEKK